MKTSLRIFGLLALALTGCTNTLADGEARLYACDRDAGLDACPSGWRCGVSGYCQNPDQPLPYPCETSLDCSGGWNCGAERLCYDRSTAVDRSCRANLDAIPDAGDCAPRWRCGRELRGQFCHPLGTGAAYLCVGDSDCEATWRCGPEGACVDVAAQGLNSSEVTFTMAQVSPLLPSQVDLLQLRVLQESEWSQLVTHRMVFIANDRLSIVANSAKLEWPFTASRESVPLARAAHALAETDEHLLVTDSTGLVDYRDALDGGVSLLVVPSLANAELRYAAKVQDKFGNSQGDEELAAFFGSTIGLCGQGTSAKHCDPSDFQIASLPANVTIKDVAFVDEDNNRRSALAATSAGPWFAPRRGTFLALDGGASTTPAWRRIALPGVSDGCATSPTPIDRLVYEPRAQILAATSSQRVWVFTLDGGLNNVGECDALAFDRRYGPCEACAPGEVLLKVGTGEQATADEPVVVALCSRGSMDGGSEVVSYRHGSKDGGCNVGPMELPLGVRRGYQVSAHSPTLVGIDSVGVPRRCPLASCDTMLFSSAPERVAGGPALLSTYKDDIYLPGDGYKTLPSGLSTPLGLRLATYSNLYVAGSVPENQDWMISSTGRSGTQGEQSLALQPMNRKLGSSPFDPIEPHALFTRSSDLLPSVNFQGELIDASGTRSFSTITTDAVGTPWLIVGAGDRVWAADSRLLAQDAGVRTVGIKIVPMPSADIQSLAFAAFDRGDAGGPLLEGYTVEQQRLFRVVVRSPALWVSDEIRLGETNTVPLTVWMEGNRGRVGTSDGRVLGLPVPVPISTTIPEAPLPTVLGYSSLCGQAFALSERALYRLKLETPPLGSWERVSLESAQPGLDGFGPHWGPVMHKARVENVEHLYLFSQTGLAVELVATCP